MRGGTSPSHRPPAALSAKTANGGSRGENDRVSGSRG